MSGGHRSRQQRLFSGALFPELLNAQLFAFAQRHHLQSNVWVPYKAIETALRPYNVLVLPHAILCDVSLTAGGGMGDVTAAIGTDRILINAEHTSKPSFLENFRDFLVCCLAPPDRALPAVPTSLISPLPSPRPPPSSSAAAVAGDVVPEWQNRADGHSAGKYLNAADKSAVASGADIGEIVDHGQLPILPPDPTWDRLPPFQYPLAMNGSPLIGIGMTKQLTQLQKENNCWSNYWRRRRDGNPQNQEFSHVSDEEHPGRYNPFFCVRYSPHSYSGLSFPPLLVAQMQFRAVMHGYVSRMWLTVQQAQEKFGTHLLPERAWEGPLVCSRYHSAGASLSVLYCADQFAGGDSLFPTLRDIQLAARGVRLASRALRAYPLLSRLCEKFNAETTRGGIDERVGFDVTMQDARRQVALHQEIKRCEAVQLHGFRKPLAEQQYLRDTQIRNALIRQCIVCDYPRPLFFSHRKLFSLGIAPRPGEQGVVQTRLPVAMDLSFSWSSGECWFNVAQLQEPALGHELVDHPPRHFLTRQNIHGPLVLQCCRAQLARRATQRAVTIGEPKPQTYRDTDLPLCEDSEWVPLFVLHMTGWKLRSHARGIPYSPHALDSVFKHFASRDAILFHLDDVCLDAADKNWLQRYTPVDAKGNPFQRGVRMLLTLRAYERGYRSTLWHLYQTQRLRTAEEPRVTLRAPTKPVRTDIPQPLTNTPVFSCPPLVKCGSFSFVNAEEVELPERSTDLSGAGASNVNDEPDAPYAQWSEGVRTLVRQGRGPSAEYALKRDHSKLSSVNDAVDDTPSPHGAAWGSRMDCEEVSIGMGEEGCMEDDEPSLLGME